MHFEQMNTVAQKAQVHAASFLRHIPSDHVVQTPCAENFNLKVSNTSHNLIDLLTGLLREPRFDLCRIGHGAVRETPHAARRGATPLKSSCVVSPHRARVSVLCASSRVVSAYRMHCTRSMHSLCTQRRQVCASYARPLARCPACLWGLPIPADVINENLQRMN